MTDHKKTILGSVVASLLSICGCGQSAPVGFKNSTLVKETQVNGFDPDGEPVIKTWSNGVIWIQFEAMPPFFSEYDGTQKEFENFETKLQVDLGVAVRRDDREVFVIDQPNHDTAERAKVWLEAYRNSESPQINAEPK